jgi:hypothetical protein
MSDETYMTDPRAKTIEGFIVALQIFAKYTKDKLQESYFCGAEHDVLYMYVDTDAVSEEDAALLDKLGWHKDESAETWAYFT